MKLTTIKPRVQTLKASRVQPLDIKAGATKRIAGYTWMKIRRAVMVRDQFACQACGRVGTDHEVDHVVPLEQGGSNDMSNLSLLCVECHKAKTASEATRRAGGG